MTFEQLWLGLIERNHNLADKTAKVTITADQFRKALQQAYDQGAAHESKTKRKVAQSEFGKIFGEPFS